MNIHHIGYYITDMEASVRSFMDLGYCAETDVVVDQKRGIRVLFMKGNGIRIELIEVIDKENCDITFLSSCRGPTMYHICYIVEKIELCIEELKNKKFKLIKKPDTAIAIENKRVAFLYNKEIGIIEILESGDNKCID